jgi:hypothetical protein
MRLALLPLAFLFAATPAVAQINGTRQASAAERERVPMGLQRGGWASELDEVQDRTREAREDGDLTRREARSVHRSARLIRSVGARFAANGLSEAELDMLESQAFALRDLSQAPNRPAPSHRRRR